MAEAMLEAMKQFKSPDGKSLRIRVGKIIARATLLLIQYKQCCREACHVHTSSRFLLSLGTVYHHTMCNCACIS